MNALISGFLGELGRAVAPVGDAKAGLIAAMTRHCHANIQFYRALRESPEFRRDLKQALGGHCTAADITEVLGRASLSVVVEEHKFPFGRYPQ